jgi:hypothetical protein
LAPAPVNGPSNARAAPPAARFSTASAIGFAFRTASGFQALTLPSQTPKKSAKKPFFNVELRLS